jgi:putative SOS response-associated peptidase YedK
MCGRFSIVKDADDIEARFGVKIDRKVYNPVYNAAPSQRLPVVTNTDTAQISFFRWGLIPYWAKDASIGYKMINAKAETIAEKPAYRASFRRKRCLVPADGFYEWQKLPSGKQPFRISMSDNSLFAFAGLWDEWKTPEGQSLCSFTIITTEPNELMLPIHNRMPVILSQAGEKIWMDDRSGVNELLSLLAPYPAELMKAWKVSQAVNYPANNYPDLLLPV